MTAAGGGASSLAVWTCAKHTGDVRNLRNTGSMIFICPAELYIAASRGNKKPLQSRYKSAEIVASGETPEDFLLIPS